MGHKDEWERVQDPRKQRNRDTYPEEGPVKAKQPTGPRGEDNRTGASQTRKGHQAPNEYQRGTSK